MTNLRSLIKFGMCFLFSLSAVACNMPSSAPVAAPSAENTALPDAQTLPTATLANDAQQPIITLTNTPFPALPIGQVNAIQFGANGTYADVADNIAAGSSKTYSVNAMKGQVMSVSVFPQILEGEWGYIPMQIKGADGAMLCPMEANSECTFWRGVLPSSQDYFITLTPAGDAVNFILRVTVNPPGKDAQYFQYTNPVSGLSLTYPDSFAPSDPPAGNYKTRPELSLHFIDSDAYDKTNLSEAYLLLSSSSDSQIVATCTEPSQSGAGPEQVDGKEAINGYTFVRSETTGAGAGNYYEQFIYRTANQGICYEVIYFIHYTNIGNYPPGVVTEFDENALTGKLNDIFSTFSINK